MRRLQLILRGAWNGVVWGGVFPLVCGCAAAAGWTRAQYPDASVAFGASAAVGYALICLLIALRARRGVL